MRDLALYVVLFYNIYYNDFYFYLYMYFSIEFTLFGINQFYLENKKPVVVVYKYYYV